MMRILFTFGSSSLILLFVLFVNPIFCQSTYHSEINQYRKTYKQSFLSEERSPLTKHDLKWIRFYPIDTSAKVTAKVTRIFDTVGFDMHTHSGVIKKYFVYAKAAFTWQGKPCLLFVYQSESLRTKKGLEDYLFIPFTDETNNLETFGGGRYLDFKMGDIRQDNLLIDFNKAYNPYCAYKGGYACPIPPRENDLAFPLKAGEKKFGKKTKE